MAHFARAQKLVEGDARTGFWNKNKIPKWMGPCFRMESTEVIGLASEELVGWPQWKDIRSWDNVKLALPHRTIAELMGYKPLVRVSIGIRKAIVKRAVNSMWYGLLIVDPSALAEKFWKNGLPAVLKNNDLDLAPVWVSI